ncbi:GAF domain-containing protein [Patescibacteria group bacterium]
MKIKKELKNEKKEVYPDDCAFFLKSILRVSHAIQETDDINQMMEDVLDLMLEIFKCDRVFLLYPCDIDAEFWNVPMERSVAEWPGLGVTPDQKVPNTPGSKGVFKAMLDADDVVAFDSTTKHETPEDIAEQFNIRSQIAIAIHPKVGKPWSFGMHQCSHARIWSEEDKVIFREISYLMGGALGNLLLLDDLKKTKGDLIKKVGELGKANELMVGRELKMIELKKELENKLEEAASGDEK